MTGTTEPARASVAGWANLTEDARRAALATAFVEADASVASHGAYITVASATGPDSVQTTGAPRELAGMPFAVKDNIDVAGLPTTGGSPLLREDVSEVDAGVVSVLREAGAVPVGKTNMHELAFGITSNNAEFGPVRNPHDLTRVAGGSSGGSATTVALGTVPFSLGTDTGGSVTIPASFCGVVGFRPTTGRYPADGLVNLSWTRDTVGIHARSVADVRLVDDVIVRGTTAPERALAQTVVGVPRRRFEDLDPEVHGVADRCLATLSDAGVRLVDVDVPDDYEIGSGPGLGLVLYEAARLLLDRARGVPGGEAYRSFADLVDRIASPDVRGLAGMMAGEPVPAAAFEQARQARWALRRAYAQMYDDTGVHLLIAPNVPVLPPPIGADETIELNGREVPVFQTITRNTAPGTVAGVPMLSVPAGRSQAGLPVGLLLEGRFGDDAELLAAGAEIAGLVEPS